MRWIQQLQERTYLQERPVKLPLFDWDCWLTRVIDHTVHDLLQLVLEVYPVVQKAAHCCDEQILAFHSYDILQPSVLHTAYSSQHRQQQARSRCIVRHCLMALADEQDESCMQQLACV